MHTTQLYIELIIIGLETSIWMCIVLINIAGTRILNAIVDILDNFSSSLLLIGVLYVIGILMDRCADIIFHEREKTIKMKSGLKAESSIIVWTNDFARYVEYSRSRIRILRVSVINIPLISVGLIFYIIGYIKHQSIIIYILILGCSFTYIAWKSYNLSVEKFYKKARILEEKQT